MKSSDRIHVAGHSGMVGSAIVRALKQRGYDNLLLPMVNSIFAMPLRFESSTVFRSPMS